MVTITIIGRDVDPVHYAENSNARVVKNELIAAFGPGILMKGLEGVLLSATLSGDYEFHVTAGRTRPVTVFDPQRTQVAPRGVVIDDDYVTASELFQLLADLKEQHGTFVCTFARALGKMKDFEKPMRDKCTVCHRTDISGYQCITCHQWVCEFCFPQVMRNEVRTTVVVLPNGVEQIHLKCPHCRGLFNEPIGPSPRRFNA